MDQTSASNIKQESILPNPFKNSDPRDVNVKGIKKLYQNQFTKFRSICRLKITGKDKIYEQYAKQILDLFRDTLKDLDNIKNGNIVVLIFVLDDLFRTMSEVGQRVSGMRDKGLLGIAHDLVLQKQSDVIKMLTDNLRKPVTLEEFEGYMKTEGVVNDQPDDAEKTGS